MVGTLHFVYGDTRVDVGIVKVELDLAVTITYILSVPEKLF